MNTEWKLVPVEPTDEMEVAAENDYEQTGATFPRWKSAYAAMLNAAPPAPTSHPIPTGATGDAQMAGDLMPKLQSLLDRMASDPRTGAMFEADGDTLRDAMSLCRSVKVCAAIGAPAAGDALDVLLLTQALQDLRQAFVIAVGDKSPFARIALEKADAAIAQQKGEA